MASNFPAALDTTATLPAAGGVGANLSTFPHSALHGNVDDAVIAIETELGTAPSGSFSTVKARFDGLPALLGEVAYAQTIANSLNYSSTITDVTGIATSWTAVSTVKYKTTIFLPSLVAAAGLVELQLTDSGNVAKQKVFHEASGAVEDFGLILVCRETGLSGSITRKARMRNTTGDLDLFGDATFPSFILVEAMG